MTTLHDPWTFYIGDTWQIEFVCLNVDTTTMVLGTGTVISWKLDNLNGEQNNWVHVDNASLGGITITDANNGICLVKVPPSATDKLMPQDYNDELTVVSPNGDVSTMCVGIITAKEKLT